MVRRRSTVRFRKGAPRSGSFFECHPMTPFGVCECMEKVILRSACRWAGQRRVRHSMSMAGGHFRGQSQRRSIVKSFGPCKGALSRSDPGAWGCVRVPGLSLCRGGRIAQAQGRGEPGVVRLGAEPAWLAELYWLSLLLKAVGSAWGSELEPGRITRRGAGDRLSRRCRCSRGPAIPVAPLTGCGSWRGGRQPGNALPIPCDP